MWGFNHDFSIAKHHSINIALQMKMSTPKKDKCWLYKKEQKEINQRISTFNIRCQTRSNEIDVPL